jgi:hypothetical protein
LPREIDVASGLGVIGRFDLMGKDHGREKGEGSREKVVGKREKVVGRREKVVGKREKIKSHRSGADPPS